MKFQYVIAIHIMRWLTNFYDFRFQWTATAAIGIHPTKAWLSQLVNFKNAIWTWGHFRRTICHKILFLNLEKMPQKVSCMNRASVFEWHKRFMEGRESVKDDERCRRSKEVDTPELVSQRVRVSLRGTTLRFKGRSERDSVRRGQPSAQWHFHQDNTPVNNSILVTDYLTKIGINTVSHPPHSPDLVPCDFWLFTKLKVKLRGCCYETIEEMTEAVTMVIDMLTQEDFSGAFQKLLERYNKCIAAGGDNFEGD